MERISATLRELFGRLLELRRLADAEADAERRATIFEDIKQYKTLILAELNSALESD